MPRIFNKNISNCSLLKAHNTDWVNWLYSKDQITRGLIQIGKTDPSSRLPKEYRPLESSPINPQTNQCVSCKRYIKLIKNPTIPKITKIILNGVPLVWKLKDRGINKNGIKGKR